MTDILEKNGFVRRTIGDYRFGSVVWKKDDYVIKEYLESWEVLYKGSTILNGNDDKLETFLKAL